MTDLTDRTIREIAVEMPATTRVFEELKIDYCCGGNKNFLEACEAANLSPDIVKNKITDALKDSDKTSIDDLTHQISPAKLIDLIIEKHHTFAQKEITRLIPLMDKVAGKHGEHHPELLSIQKTFTDLCNDLMPHMQKEEVVLFPYIKNIEASEITNQPASRPPFGTVQNPVRMMQGEHDTAGDFLKQIRKLTNDYKLPEAACPSFQSLYFGLEELERDLHQHIHLENNILFPLAIELEEKVLAAAV